MAIFPTLDIEEKIQVGDKTRFSATKSYVTKDESAVTAVTVTPGADGSPISVFNADQNEWYLDYQWSSWAFDIDSSNAKIYFKQGGTYYTAPLTPGTYADIGSLTDEIENAFGLAGSPASFSFDVDTNNKITITSDVEFQLLVKDQVWYQDHVLRYTDVIADTEASLTQYITFESGLKKITVAVTNSGGTESASFYQKVISEDLDLLFSSDSDLMVYEPDLPKWVPPGRNSFKDVHRLAQTLIIDWLEGSGFLNDDARAFTKYDIIGFREVKQWSVFLALGLIFQGNSNSIDDVFDKKSRYYKSKAMVARSRFISIDLDADGKIDFNESMRLGSGSLYRR